MKWLPLTWNSFIMSLCSLKKITYAIYCIYSCLNSKNPSLCTVICLLSSPHPPLSPALCFQICPSRLQWLWYHYPASSNPRFLGYGISYCDYLDVFVMIHSLKPSFHACYFLEVTLFYSSVATTVSKYNTLLSTFFLTCLLKSSVLIVSGTST